MANPNVIDGSGIGVSATLLMQMALMIPKLSGAAISVIVMLPATGVTLSKSANCLESNHRLPSPKA